jgi:hypothetical protein
MTGKHEQKHNSWLHIDTHKCGTFWYLSCNNENGCEQGIFIGSPQMKKAATGNNNEHFGRVVIKLLA